MHEVPAGRLRAECGQGRRKMADPAPSAKDGKMLRCSDRGQAPTRRKLANVSSITYHEGHLIMPGGTPVCAVTARADISRNM